MWVAERAIVIDVFSFDVIISKRKACIPRFPLWKKTLSTPADSKAVFSTSLPSIDIMLFITIFRFFSHVMTNESNEYRDVKPKEWFAVIWIWRVYKRVFFDNENTIRIGKKERCQSQSKRPKWKSVPTFVRGQRIEWNGTWAIHWTHASLNPADQFFTMSSCLWSESILIFDLYHPTFQVVFFVSFIVIDRSSILWSSKFSSLTAFLYSSLF